MGIHVLILAEIELGGMGGGESAIHGLVRGLAAQDLGGDRITILCPPSLAGDLRPLLAPGMSVISRPLPEKCLGDLLRRLLGPLRRPLGRIFRRFTGKQEQGLPEQVPLFDSFILSIGQDVTHFMVPQHYASDGKASVFTIHDLQHEHLPYIFGEAAIRYRRMLYDAVARECAAVVAISDFTSQDFQKHHPCPPGKLVTIPWAAYVSPESALMQLSGADQGRLSSLPTDFILYPAYSYEHKNHIRLLQALSLLEAREGVRIPLVCTGGRSPFWRKVLSSRLALKPCPEMLDLRYVSRALLHELFRKARFVVFPSLFEGAGLPLLEAASMACPIACSDIPPFREFGGAGPCFFDPENPGEMASVIFRLWCDPDERTRSARESAGASANLSWERCGRSYLDIYRKVASLPSLGR